MMKTMGNKSQFEYLILCDVLIMENGLKGFLNHYCCELCNVMKMVIFSYLCEHVICIILRHDGEKCYMH